MASLTTQAHNVVEQPQTCFYLLAVVVQKLMLLELHVFYAHPSQSTCNVTV